ncbi:TPA: DUF3987 domain-containing protein [Raoultella ornithinolytica]|uniref:DUF3987 domain-containing protein n=2 Tax=Klebsiella/Raoultella group TaxID=2890311 RepID=UPI0031624A0B
MSQLATEKLQGAATDIHPLIIPTIITEKPWLGPTAKMLEERGYSPIPIRIINGSNTPRPYSEGQTYPVNKSNQNWTQGVSKHVVGIRLDNAILLDYDGNKADAGEIITVGALASLLGLSDLMPFCVQTNDAGTSLHFLFRWPADADRSLFNQANNGRWQKHIDIKTGNQLCYIKAGKTIVGGEFPQLDSLPIVPAALLEALRKDTRQATESTYSPDIRIETDIAWYNSNARPWPVMLASAGFKKRGNKWLHPASTTGAAGASINSEERYISSHGADPLADGHTHDKFDFAVAYEYNSDSSKLLSEIREKRSQQTTVAVVTSATTSSNIDQGWSVPLDLKSDLSPVMPFDSELLPQSVRGYVIDYAARMDNAAPDFAAISVMIAAGALIGGTAEIQPKRNDTGWRLVPNLWGSAIGYPSAMKTPSLKCGLSLLDHAQKSINREFAKRKKRFDAEILIAEVRNEKLESDIKQAADDGDVDRVLELKEQISEHTPSSPKHRELMVNDSTVEAIAIMMENSPLGILVFRDELSGWIAALDNPQRAHERAFYLEGFSCGQFKQNRVGRGKVNIDKLIVSLSGGIQPGKLAPILASRAAGSGDDGLLERIIQMSVFPDLVGEYSDRTPDMLAEQIAKSVFEALADLGNDINDPTLFKFDGTAQSIWTEWATTHKQRERAADPNWQGILGKYPALCAKLALICHMIDEAAASRCGEVFSPSVIISEFAIRRAIQWMQYLESHAERITSYFKAEKAMLPATTLRDRLPQLAPSFTRNSLGQKDWKNLTSKEEREMAIGQLLKTGHIREVTTQPKGGIGRSTVSFFVNPLI